MRKRRSTWLLLLLAPLMLTSQSAEGMPKSKYADFDGLKVHYIDAPGPGANALILVHGWACSAEFWRLSINEFPDYHVIAIDLPGHGRSDKPHVDFTMNYFARSIEAVMRNAGIEKAVLVGHSMGTPVIRQFYRLYPNRTLGLIVVDGSLRPPTEQDIARSVEPLRADYMGNVTKLVDALVGPIRSDQLKEEIRSTMLATPEYVGLSAMEAMSDKRIWMNDKIDVPVLAILADEPWWKSDTEVSYRLIASKLDFRMWHGVSHFLMMEEPALFNQTVRLFISSGNLL